VSRGQASDTHWAETASGGGSERHGRGRIWGRVAGVVVWSLAVLLGPAAGQVQAHAVLTGSSPGEGATLNTAPSQVVLVFDENVQTQFADIVVTAPDGARISTGDAVVTDNKVTATVGPPTVKGGYTVAWRVVSDDGHPVDGQFTYTLTRHALTTGRVAGPVAIAPTRSSDPWASEHAAVLAVGAVVGVGLLLLLWQRQHRGWPFAS
jgi:methionine-rich copper-binding protein CopC